MTVGWTQTQIYSGQPRINPSFHPVFNFLISVTEYPTGHEDKDGIGRYIQDHGRRFEVLHMVNPVDEYVVQELQEITEFNEKKIKSTTNQG